MLRVRVTVGLSGSNARKEGQGQRSILTSLPFPAPMQGPEGQGPALDRQAEYKEIRGGSESKQDQAAYSAAYGTGLVF